MSLRTKLKSHLILALKAIGLVGLFSDYAHAYIDPGTSSVVFSLLGQIMAVLAVFLGIFFRPVIRFFKYIFQKAKQYPKLSIPILLGIGLIAGIGGYKLLSPFLYEEEGMPMTHTQGKKVIVLGMDGLDTKVMERLLAAGELPNFSHLKESGSYSPLQTSNPAQSPVAWSSLATGCNPGKYGIYDFIKRDPQTYLPDLAILKQKKGVLASGSDFTPVRQATAFWEITAAAGIPSTIIRWPITFPPKENKAKVFAGLGVPDIKGSLGSYTFYTTQPVAPDDEGKHKVIVVTPGAETINTEIVGPKVGGIKKTTANLPLSIKLDKTNKQATIEVDGQSLVLKEKAWSDWVELKFKVGFMKKVRGIVKFYLTKVDPLQLYLSPIEVHPQQPVFRVTNPDEYAGELAEQLGLYHTLGMPEDTKALTEGRFGEDAFLESCKQIMSEREKMLAYELSRFDQGLLAFVFDTTDRIQHMFWRFEEPDLFGTDKAAYEKYKDVVEDYYRWMDNVLESVLKYVDHNTTLIVCSDHGFSSFRRAVQLNSWLAQNGYMTLTSNEAQRKDNTLFSDVNWNNTRAYALGFGSIYLNLKGREKQGIVLPDKARALSKEIAQKLGELIDPLTGTKVVQRVYLRDEIYSGPYLNDSPDLVVGFRPGYRVSWQAAIGGAPAGLFDDNLKAWSGDHCIDPQFVPGILFLNRKLQTTNPSLIDIAPTVLDVLGLAIPEEMDGKSLFGGG